MHLYFACLLATTLALLAGKSICAPDDPTDCYPEIFSPTDKWQVVREGQHVPPGLHVRLDINTGLQEARLLQPESNDDAAVVVVEADEPEAQEISQQTQIQIPRKSRKHVDEEKLHGFEEAVEAILDMNSSIEKFDEALDFLIDVSHDLEYGTRLARDPNVFSAMMSAIETAADRNVVAEKVYRVIGSSLRNNPDGTKAFLWGQRNTLVPQLFSELESEQTSDTTKKRILGVVHAISMDPDYAQMHLGGYNHRGGDVLRRLVAVFPLLSETAQERVLFILEDAQVIGSRPGDESLSAASRMSAFLQAELSQGRVDDGKRVSSALQALVALHKRELLDVSSDFTSWMSRAEDALGPVLEEARAYLTQRSMDEL